MSTQNEIKEFLQKNIHTESYRGLKYDYIYGQPTDIDLSIQSEIIINRAEKDLAIIKERSKKYMEREGFKVGERIELPDGQEVMISHVWDDTVQTSNGGSMHLSSGGGISFSGGLDSGLKKSDLIRIDTLGEANIWIFHNNSAGGGRGVYHTIPVTKYRTKRGADLSGVPQVEELRKQKIREKAEKITFINGNGNNYTLPLPELCILNRTPSKSDYNKVKEFPRTDCTISGLKFEANGMDNLVCQPMKLSQITRLLRENDFKVEHHNNASSRNTLYLTPTISDREITREFPTVGAFYQKPFVPNKATKTDF